MTESDLHYAAGLLEGEGCFALTVNNSNRPSPTLYPNVQIKMTDREPLERLQAAVGGKIWGPYKSKNLKWRPYFRWAICRRDGSIKLLERLFPLMSPRRQLAISKILSYQFRRENRQTRK